MNFGNFDLADAAILGGIAGFVEEAIENERFGEREKITTSDIDEKDIEDTNLRLLYNQNPDLVLYLINKFLDHKKVAAINHEFKIIMAEIEKEIEQMEKEEIEKNENSNRYDK